ncbi:hypothetical protein SAMN06295900_102300 [Trinickia caryophylli]|uniref:Uncharacterized protein n=1 Tax=Trinickia caryophylli TaxID=28094 RepID=A0A1X7D2L7_TRICW|nr:hypothetical protein SAMN06295900_102300 [Trinickia caryophylli]
MASVLISGNRLGSADFGAHIINLFRNNLEFAVVNLAL